MPSDTQGGFLALESFAGQELGPKTQCCSHRLPGAPGLEPHAGGPTLPGGPTRLVALWLAGAPSSSDVLVEALMPSTTPTHHTQLGGLQCGCQSPVEQHGSTNLVWRAESCRGGPSSEILLPPNPSPLWACDERTALMSFKMPAGHSSSDLDGSLQQTSFLSGSSSESPLMVGSQAV